MRCPGNIKAPRKLEKRKDAWVWRPPDAKYLKVNVDGSFLGESNRGY